VKNEDKKLKTKMGQKTKTKNRQKIEDKKSQLKKQVKNDVKKTMTKNVGKKLKSENRRQKTASQKIDKAKSEICVEGIERKNVNIGVKKSGVNIFIYYTANGAGW
jgi:hypothetical protein